MKTKQPPDTAKPMESDTVYWNRRAAFYDKTVGNRRGFHRDQITRIKRALNPEDIVVEIACGTGVIACAVASHVKAVYASDFAPRMLEIARLRARRQGLGNVRFARENACALSCPDSCCDAVIICAALHLLAQPKKAMAEIRRILKPGGLLLTSSYLARQSLMNRLGNALMSMGGYRDRQKWNAEAFLRFLQDQGFAVKDSCQYTVFPIPVQYVIAQMQTLN